MQIDTQTKVIAGAIVLGSLLIAGALLYDPAPRYRYSTLEGFTLRTDLESGEITTNRGGRWQTISEHLRESEEEAAAEEKQRAEVAERTRQEAEARHESLRDRIAQVRQVHTEFIEQGWPRGLEHEHAMEAALRGLTREEYAQELRAQINQVRARGGVSARFFEIPHLEAKLRDIGYGPPERDSR